MPDLEKVIKGLECCVRSENKNCPTACAFYNECFMTNGSTPFYPALRAALERLKEQPDIVRCKNRCPCDA